MECGTYHESTKDAGPSEAKNKTKKTKQKQETKKNN